MAENILLIDIGNTAIKWCFNDQHQSILVDDFSLDLLPEAEKIFVSCVGDASLLDDLEGVIFVKSSKVFRSFKSSYEDPSSLGADRFLAMIGAINLYPDRTLLIVDAGSALTFDLVLNNGTHQGGLIMPGLAKLRRSFDQFCTESQQLHNQKLGLSTSQAWACGTGEMFISVINAQIEHHLEQFGDLLVVLTGGDGKIASLRVHHPCEFQPNLVLDGLAHYAKHAQS